MILPLINPLYKYVAIALLVFGLLTGIYFKGRSDVNVKFDAYKLEVKQLAEKAIEENKRKEKESLDVNTKLSNDWAANMDALRDSYAKRVPVKSSTGPMPGISRGPTTLDEATSDRVSAEGLAFQCQETTLMVDGWQQWYLEQRNVYNQK